MEERKKPRRGLCEACSIEYDREIFYVDLDSRFADYVYRLCPNCHYDPDFETEIYNILRARIELTINSLGRISTNYQNLAELVIKHFQEHWPKPKGNSEKGGKKI